ncbi:MAG: LptF/LptG family permease [Leadbetterella sp.]
MFSRITRLERYLILRFLKTYVFSVFIIICIVLIFDLGEKIDDFMESSPPLKSILVDYYLNLSAYWAIKLSPLMIFISTVFFTAKMAANTEIVAILSSGTSFLRFMRAYFLGSIVVAVGTFVMIGWVIPNANSKKSKFIDQYINPNKTYEGRDFHMAIDKNTYIYLSNYDIPTKTAYDFTLEKIQNNQLIEKLTARRAVYIDSTKKWQLNEYRTRKLGIMKDQLQEFTLKAKDTTLNLLPTDFESTKNFQETFTLPRLNKQISRINSRGGEGVEVFEVEYFSRFATPFAVVILSLMGVIVSSRKSRGGIGLQIAIGFLLAFSYILFYITSQSFALAGDLSPALAVWLPNIVFSFITVFLYFTVPR